MNDEKDDEMGYGRPPKRTQFRAGQSGNPSGRPKGVRNFRTELLEELAEPITISEGECEITVSKQRACIKALVAAAIAGNARACGALVALCAKYDGDVEPDGQLAPDDRELLDAFAARGAKRRNERE